MSMRLPLSLRQCGLGVLTVVIAGLFSGGISAAQSADEYAALIAQAKADLNAGNAAKALEKAQQAEKIDTNGWEAYVVAGAAQQLEKSYEAAIDSFATALAVAPEDRRSAINELLKKHAREMLKDAAPQTQTSGRVGVIDVQAAITSTSEGKHAAAELQSKFAPRQTELQNLQKQLEDIQARLRTGANTLTDDEKARLTRAGENIQQSYQRKSKDAQDDFQLAQREVVDNIGRKMIDVLNRYSHDNGYAMILDRSGQSTPVIYAANSSDVTQEIVRLYDAKYSANGK
jgi:outer membrane protein